MNFGISLFFLALWETASFWKKNKTQKTTTGSHLNKNLVKKFFFLEQFRHKLHHFSPQKQCQRENSMGKRISEARDTSLILEIFIQKIHLIVHSFYICKNEPCIFALQSFNEKTNTQSTIL